MSLTREGEGEREKEKEKEREREKYRCSKQGVSDRWRFEP
jgi:hypothetical protein